MSCGTFISDGVLFAQYSDRKVINYDMNGSIVSQIDLPGNLYDISDVDDSQIAISSGGCRIFVVDIKTMVLTKTVSIATVYGLRYVGDQIIGLDGISIYHFKVCGGEFISKKETRGENFFISANSERDFRWLRDYCTICERERNYAIQQPKAVSSTRGIDIDKDDNIYVSGHNSGRLIQRSREGKLIRTILAETIGLKQPWVVRFKRNTNKFFFVTCNETGGVAFCSIV